MPSNSKKQARLMAAVAHNPKFAKKVGISQKVGKEFHANSICPTRVPKESPFQRGHMSSTTCDQMKE